MKILRSKGKAVHKMYKPLTTQCPQAKVVRNRGCSKDFDKCIGETYNVVKVSPRINLSTGQPFIKVALDCSKDLGEGCKMTWWNESEVEIIK